MGGEGGVLNSGMRGLFTGAQASCYSDVLVTLLVGGYVRVGDRIPIIIPIAPIYIPIILPEPQTLYPCTPIVMVPIFTPPLPLSTTRSCPNVSCITPHPVTVYVTYHIQGYMEP